MRLRGEALARGHEIVLSSRSGPGALGGKAAELGRGASAATVKEAASLGYVLLAVPWKNVEAALRGLPEWNGRVLIDATNPFSETSPNLVLADLGGIGASEIVAGFAPGARIIKAFNSIRMDRFNEGPVKGQGKRVIFVSGDDAEAKRVEYGVRYTSKLGVQRVLGGSAGGQAYAREQTERKRHQKNQPGMRNPG